MKKLFYAVIFLGVFVLGLTFAARNPHSVSIDYYFGLSLELPITLVLLVTLAIGVVVGYVFSLAGGIRRYRRRVQKERRRSGKSPNTHIATREV